MPLKNVYVVARGTSLRPVLQHKLVDGQSEMTACGRRMVGWSRGFTPHRLDAILYLHAACRA